MRFIFTVKQVLQEATQSKYVFLGFIYIIVIIMINTMVSEILGIVLTFILSFAYFYLTELLLIIIISPIILLIVTFSPSLPNKTKIFILIFNIIYSSLLLSIIQNYEMVLNNIYDKLFFDIQLNLGRNIQKYGVIYHSICNNKYYNDIFLQIQRTY